MPTATKTPAAKKAAAPKRERKAARKADPPVPTVIPAEPVTWTLAGDNATALCRRLRVAAIAASTDDGRRVLTMIHLQHDGDTLRIEATDSYRLHVIETPAPAELGYRPVEAYFPASLVKHLPRRFPKRDVFLCGKWGKGDRTLTVRFTSATATIDTGDVTVTMPVDGSWQYPNTRTFTEQYSGGEESDQERAFNPRFLAQTFKAAEMFSADPRAWRSPPIRIRHIDPMKPNRFEVVDRSSKLTMLLMPMRVLP